MSPYIKYLLHIKQGPVVLKGVPVADSTCCSHNPCRKFSPTTCSKPYST